MGLLRLCRRFQNKNRGQESNRDVVREGREGVQCEEKYILYYYWGVSEP